MSLYCIICTICTTAHGVHKSLYLCGARSISDSKAATVVVSACYTSQHHLLHANDPRVANGHGPGGVAYPKKLFIQV